MLQEKEEQAILTLIVLLALAAIFAGCFIPASRLGLKSEQAGQIRQGLWLLVAAMTLIAAILPRSFGSVLLPGLDIHTRGALLLYPFAFTGFLCGNQFSQRITRITLSCVLASLAVLSVSPVGLVLGAGLAQVLLLSGRSVSMRGVVSLALFVPACAPGGEWIACSALLFAVVRQYGAGSSLLAEPIITMGCALALVLRIIQYPDVPAGAGWFLLAGGTGAALWQAAMAVSALRIRQVCSAIAGLIGAICVSAAGLFLVAQNSGSHLSAQAAEAVLTLSLLCLWPALAAFLLSAEHVIRQTGTDELGKAGGLLSFAPGLSRMLLATFCMLLFMPPAGAFGVSWLLAETVLGLVPEGYAQALPFIGLLLVMGAVTALNILTFLRLATLLLLGGPRTPAVTTGRDADNNSLISVLLCCGVSGILSLLPGLFSRRAGSSVFTLIAPDGFSSWTPVFFLLTGCAMSVGIQFLRKRRLTGQRPAVSPFLKEDAAQYDGPWSDGMQTRTHWLPFGAPVSWIAPDMPASSLRAIAGISDATVRKLRMFPKKSVRKLLFLRGRILHGSRLTEKYGLAFILLTTALGLWIVSLRP